MHIAARIRAAASPWRPRPASDSLSSFKSLIGGAVQDFTNLQRSGPAPQLWPAEPRLPTEFSTGFVDKKGIHPAYSYLGRKAATGIKKATHLGYGTILRRPPLARRPRTDVRVQRRDGDLGRGPGRRACAESCRISLHFIPSRRQTLMPNRINRDQTVTP